MAFIREKTYTLPITLPITPEVPTGSVPREKTAMKTDDPNHPYIQTITSKHPLKDKGKESLKKVV